MDAVRGNREPEGRTDQLLALIDRLEDLLQQSALQELEVEAGETTLILRTPAAVAPAVDARSMAAMAAAGGWVPAADSAHATSGGAPAVDAGGEPGASPLAGPRQDRHAVLAPLTGIFYSSPTPEAAAYVRLGGHVQEGQVIGLIEAMKLFNEIKSDASGTVARIVAESGALVKAKSPLIELERA